MIKCRHCGKTLVSDEIAVYKKMDCREPNDFLCKDCLADNFKCDIEIIDRKINQFKQMGCLLFFPEKIPQQLR